MPFLTEVDSRAAIKGSRDPLGFVPLWSHMGRFVVGNLSTVSNSVRGFTTLLLGYYFAEAVQDRHGSEAGSTLDLFLKFEQLAGYSRYHVFRDDEFRGLDRVKQALAKGSKPLLGASTDCQILSNQKIYGLWGLFSVPARTSDLLASDELILTPSARAFVEQQYIRSLNNQGFRDGRAIIDLLAPKRVELHLEGKHRELARAVATLLRPSFSALEREVYGQHLVHGGPRDDTAGRQGQLAELLRGIPQDTEFGISELRAVIKQARKRGEDWRLLADWLVSIERVETVLAPAMAAFGFCLTRNGQALRKVAGEVKKCWGGSLKHVCSDDVAALRPVIAEALGDDRSADRLIAVAGSLSAGDYELFVRLLIEHNAAVMQARNGAAPWVILDGERLDVRLRDESERLPDARELPHLWRNPYFINSLKRVQATVMEA
jgi:hypothetical protein